MFEFWVALKGKESLLGAGGSRHAARQRSEERIGEVQTGKRECECRLARAQGEEALVTDATRQTRDDG